MFQMPMSSPMIMMTLGRFCASADDDRKHRDRECADEHT